MDHSSVALWKSEGDISSTPLRVRLNVAQRSTRDITPPCLRRIPRFESVTYSARLRASSDM